jgi:hypothetical protein
MAALFVHVVKECCSGDLAMVCIREECLQRRHIHANMSPLETCWNRGPPAKNVSAGDISWRGPRYSMCLCRFSTAIVHQTLLRLSFFLAELVVMMTILRCLLTKLLVPAQLALVVGRVPTSREWQCIIHACGDVCV